MMKTAGIWNQVNWNLKQVSSLQLCMILTKSRSLSYPVSSPEKKELVIPTSQGCCED